MPILWRLGQLRMTVTETAPVMFVYMLGTGQAGYKKEQILMVKQHLIIRAVPDHQAEPELADQSACPMPIPWRLEQLVMTATEPPPVRCGFMIGTAQSGYKEE